ncbi:MAG: hypothetical protein ACOYLB_15780 [Phototrophicaceae bacterium]
MTTGQPLSAQRVQINPYLIYEFRHGQIHYFVFASQKDLQPLSEAVLRKIVDDYADFSEKLMREHDREQPFLAFLDLADRKSTSTQYVMQQMRKVYRRVPPPPKMRVVYTHSNRLMLSLTKSLLNGVKIGMVQRRFYQRDEYEDAVDWLLEPF